MKCPFCRGRSTEVFNTRSTRFDSQIWRRRRCLRCHESFTTYEAPDLTFLKVANKFGKNQSYSRAILYSDIYEAFLKVPAKQVTINAVTDTVENKILDKQTSVVTTQEIAAIMLSTLKHFDTTAFLRYLTGQTDLATSAQLTKELKKY